MVEVELIVHKVRFGYVASYARDGALSWCCGASLVYCPRQIAPLRDGSVLTKERVYLCCVEDSCRAVVVYAVVYLAIAYLATLGYDNFVVRLDVCYLLSRVVCRFVELVLELVEVLLR